MSETQSFDPWDQDAADTLIGSYVIVGIDVYTQDREHADRYQLHGIIEQADRQHGMRIRLPNGEHYVLPPWPSAFKAADPEATYTLRSTGEEITGVEFTASWDIERPNPIDAKHE